MNERSPLADAVRLRRKRAELRRRLWSLVSKVLCVTGLCICTGLCVFEIAAVSGNEMYPALREGDLIVVYRRGAPAVGDVVLYEVNGIEHIGRVEACAGQEISCAGDGQLMIDGAFQPVQERAGIYHKTYVDNADGSYPMTVPAGAYYVLCDDRTRDADSRSYGPVPADAVRGRVITVIRRRLI